MANVKITDLTSGSALIGTELFESVQTASSVKLTASQIKQYVLSNAYIQCVDLTDQTAVVDTPTPVKFNTTVVSNNISVTNNGSGNPTRITFANNGLYNVSVNLQIDNSAAADHTLRIWQRINGVDLAATSSIVSVPKAADGGTDVFELNTLVQMTAGQYLEIMYAVSNVALTLRFDAATVSPYASPTVPSAIFIATQVN
jgi:hypothetical protein